MIQVTPTWNERAWYRRVSRALADFIQDERTPQSLCSPFRCAYPEDISMTQRRTSARLPAIQTCHKPNTAHRGGESPSLRIP